MLLNDNLSSGLEPEEHKSFLAQQIDDFYATIMRQAYFTIFEINAHKAIAEANIPAEGIAQIYLNNLKQQFGHSVHVTADIQLGMVVHTTLLSYSILLLCLFFWQFISIITLRSV